MKQPGRTLVILAIGGVITGVGIALALRGLLRARRLSPTTTRCAGELRLPDGSPVVASSSTTGGALVVLDSKALSRIVYETANAGPMAESPVSPRAADRGDTNEQPCPDGASPAGQWVGNTRTRVYHRADSHFLPAEANREYFASEEAALAAGYRRASHE